MLSLTKLMSSQTARATQSLAAGRAPKLCRESMNKRIIDVSYAVRGKILLASFDIQVGIRGVVGLGFS